MVDSSRPDAFACLHTTASTDGWAKSLEAALMLGAALNRAGLARLLTDLGNTRDETILADANAEQAN